MTTKIIDVENDINEMITRFSKCSFPQMSYIAKNYSVADLIDDLISVRDKIKGIERASP